MDLSTDHYIQLIIASSAGVILFVAAYVLPTRTVMWMLLLLIPFQVINSKSGSINLVLTSVVGIAFFLRGHFVRLPLFGSTVVIMFAYFISFSQILPGTVRDHSLYLIAISSNFILFYLTYNFVRNSGNSRDIWNIVAVLNVLVLIYCGLEIFAGSEGIRLLGLDELHIKSGRLEGGRLTGPFVAVAMTADYLGIQSLFCVYALMRFSGYRYKVFWLGLLAGNLAFLVATGNRGGIISLVVGLVVFLFLFRKELGMLKIVIWVVAGSVVFAIPAYTIVRYTQYNVLFERFEQTEFHDGIPDTRSGWVSMWDQLVSKPVVGHGPRLRLYDEHNRKIPGHSYISYPHNAYFYLIYTIGLVGLLAYIWFFLKLALQYWKGTSNQAKDALLRGLPRLGVAILVLFAVSQLRMEMFRFTLHSYQQYLFMLIGAFLALTHLAMELPSRNDITMGQSRRC